MSLRAASIMQTNIIRIINFLTPAALHLEPRPKDQCDHSNPAGCFYRCEIENSKGGSHAVHALHIRRWSRLRHCRGGVGAPRMRSNPGWLTSVRRVLL